MTGPRVVPQGTDRYDGWRRLAEQAAKELVVSELDQVWTFPKLRHERREFGTAVFSRVQGDRRKIYTGRWALVIRGADRGQYQGAIEEVGSGPLEALEAMLLEVRRRIDDAEPPEPVSVRDFFGAELLAASALAVAAEQEAALAIESATDDALGDALHEDDGIVASSDEAPPAAPETEDERDGSPQS